MQQPPPPSPALSARTISVYLTTTGSEVAGKIHFTKPEQWVCTPSTRVVWTGETQKCTIKENSAESVENCREVTCLCIYLSNQHEEAGRDGIQLFFLFLFFSECESQTQHSLVLVPFTGPKLLYESRVELK